MLCAISGEAPQVPVASKKSGAIFEKRLIELYITENGKDPVTNEELSLEDLVELQTVVRTVRPRPPQFTSIPSLLSAFQNEWDALALERFRLQQDLEQTRKELATALYQNDAAIRVLARLQKERDEARDALSKLSVNGGSAGGGGDTDMQTDGDNASRLPAELSGIVEETQAQLSATRRKRPIPQDWVTAEEVGAFKVQKLTDDAGTSSKFLAADSKGDKLLHAAGQKPGTAAILSVADGRNVQTVDSHQDGQVSSGIFVNDTDVAVGTSTGAIGILNGSNQLDDTRIPHSGEVTSVSAHPSGSFFGSTGSDKQVIFFRDDDKKPAGGIEILSRFKTGTALTCGEFHPDGHIFAAGSVDGDVQIYATDNGSKVGTFEVGGPVQSLSFSENGTWLAVSITAQPEVQIWDLRKGTAVHRLSGKGPISHVRWDYTGQFLAMAGSQGITIFSWTKSSKKWTELLHTPAEAVSVVWGAQGKKLYATDSTGSVFELGI